MTATPATRTARDRLRETQGDEARALNAVETAARVRDRAQERLDAADLALAQAQAEVVVASGLEWAAYLLELETAELRRRIRFAEREAQVEGQRMVSITESSTARQA